MATSLHRTVVLVGLALMLTALVFPVVHAEVIEVTVKIGLCGDGIVDSTEECDGSNLGGSSCVARGFSAGELRCGLSCEFDTTQCSGEASQGTGSNGTLSSGRGGGGGGATNANQANNPLVAAPQSHELDPSVLKTLYDILVRILPPLLATTEIPDSSSRGSPEITAAAASAVRTVPASRDDSQTRVSTPTTGAAKNVESQALRRIMRTVQNLSDLLLKRLPSLIQSSSTFKSPFQVRAFTQLGAAALPYAGVNINATITPLPDGVSETRMGRAVRFLGQLFMRLAF